MNRLFSNTYRLYYSLLLTFAGLILFMGYLNVQDAESFMIIALTFVVLGCGILFGILPALIFTLLFLFFIGSVMFFTELGHENSLFSNQTLQDVVIWGVALLFSLFQREACMNGSIRRVTPLNNKSRPSNNLWRLTRQQDLTMLSE